MRHGVEITTGAGYRPAGARVYFRWKTSGSHCLLTGRPEPGLKHRGIAGNRKEFLRLSLCFPSVNPGPCDLAGRLLEEGQEYAQQKYNKCDYLISFRVMGNLSHHQRNLMRRVEPLFMEEYLDERVY
jgi:hypothetical protein